MNLFKENQSLIKVISLACIVMLCCSCGSGVQLRRSKLQPIHPQYSATLANAPYRVRPEKDFSKEHKELLTLFREPTKLVDSVKVYFNPNKYLTLEYSKNGQVFSKVFEGRFSQRGYYEFYLEKQKVEIPPLLPVIYSKVHIDRYRLCLTKEGNLLVDNFHENSGNIFILSAGVRYRYQSFYAGASKR